MSRHLTDRLGNLIGDSPEKADPFTSNFLFQKRRGYEKEVEEENLLKGYMRRLLIGAKMIYPLEEMSTYRSRNGFKPTPSSSFVQAIRDRERRIDE